MATELTTYNPADVILMINGVQITGFAEGTMINLRRNDENYKAQISGDGRLMTRSKTNNRSGVLTLALAQASLSNLYLSKLARRDEVQSDGVVSLGLQDLQSPDTSFNGSQSYVQRPAPGLYASTAQPREWEIFITEVEMMHGGNPPAAVLTAAL